MEMTEKMNNKVEEIVKELSNDGFTVDEARRISLKLSGDLSDIGRELANRTTWEKPLESVLKALNES